MKIVTKDKGTSTNSVTIPVSQNCENCPRVINSGTATMNTSIEQQFVVLLTQSLSDIKNLQEDILKVEKKQDRTDEFYNGIAKLTKISKIAIIILMIIPVLQLIACAAVVYYLGIQEQLSGLLTWILGGVSLLSIVEVGITAIKYFTLENKVEELEKKIKKLEDTDE